MKKMLLILIVTSLFGVAPFAAGGEVKDYSSTINVFKSSPAVDKFFKNSYGYAVYPTIGKAGWVIGGSFGKGQVYRGGKVTGTSSLIEDSIGFQLGGEAFSEIIFFQDKRAYNEFTSRQLRVWSHRSSGSHHSRSPGQGGNCWSQCRRQCWTQDWIPGRNQLR